MITWSDDFLIRSRRKFTDSDLEFNRTGVETGICEAQGTCINCDNDSFSYYKCSVPHDCFTNEICTKQGFCCPTNKTLSSLSNDDFAVQCRTGTEECWCVSPFGGIIGSLKPKTADSNAACEALRLTLKHQFLATPHSLLLNSAPVKAECTENEQFAECVDECQPACFSRTSITCFSGRCKSGCQCKPGFIRQRNDLHAPCIPRNQCPLRITESERHCIDPLREYKTCGPACPISCSSENEKCRTERCVEGCFCKVPYILENGIDPLRSRCILSIYCPPLARDNSSINSTIHLTAMAPMTPKFHLFPEHREDSTNQSTATQCSDPLKNFQICGSGCPGGCNNQIAGFCGTQCVAGCFCRNPYILQDAYNLNSQCVLPHQCQSSIIQHQQICSDPRKEWTSCFSYECVRSCSNPKATCTTDDCTPGCMCREPYLLYDSNNANSRCVLPSECGSQCSDSLKEYQACASSCPMGCNNRIPQTCSPCVSGCFCKSGFVFEDAVNWRTSKCISLNQCPMTNISAFLVAFIPENNKLANITECPATTADLSGKFCNFDSDCPAQQRCCHSTLFAMTSSKQSRCTCIDPHAYWDPCGALCPEYCGQLATPVCSSTCNPGCHCAYGYVKARNHVNAPCVPRTQCFQPEYQKHTNKPYSMWKEIATVKMLSDGNKIIGDVRIKEISKERIKLEGTVKGLPIGEHALIIHQAGDLSDSCANIGPIMASDKKFNVSAIFGNVKADGIKNATIDREIDWPQDISLIGRSLVIHKLSVMEWSLRNEDVLPLACGTIGFASS
ncbi:unnamed protein product [Onchocerca flexuosa]|uniref:Trypsin Inhibitor like cysteine rich domain protein n=1 Tax=Onchocerca flexuosa TaxID=387005 RepID=A0A183HZ60_9BILA|nr:unnamed protein product [Onchocerca flexuosa]